MKSLKDCIKLAPLHNPPNIMGIEAAMELMPNVPEVGVFDTAFHVRSLPKHAYLYAIPYKYYEKYKIRRYGFHGTSHKYVSTEAAKMLGKPIEELKIITCHLGNGASIAAIDGGRSIDTTMGFTPLEGLYMGTRSGDLDPAILIYLMDEEGLTSQEVYNLLNKQSGMLGVTGMTSDMRDIEDAALEGNERAKLALDMYSYKIKKYVGAYAAALGGLDVIVFTGGIGENSDIVRRDVCRDLGYMGVKIDDSKNDGLRGKKVDISASDSRVKVLVIPTNEEIVIARDTKEIVEKNLDIL
jgi:acetate kinase